MLVIVIEYAESLPTIVDESEQSSGDCCSHKLEQSSNTELEFEKLNTFWNQRKPFSLS